MPLQTLQQFPVTQSGGVLGPVLSQLAPIVKNIKAKREGEEQQRRQQLAALALTARNQEDPQERRMVLLRALSSFPKDSEQVKQIIAATNERDPDKFNVELAKIAAFNSGQPVPGKKPGKLTTLAPGNVAIDSAGNVVARNDAGGKGGLASAKTEILSTGTVIQALPDGTTQVRDPEGNIATGKQRTELIKEALRVDGLKSESEVNQILEIEKAKEAIRRDDVKRALELQQIETNIEQKQQKVTASKEKVKKAEELKTTMSRVIGDLLANKDGVRSFVGTLDSITPTLLPGTARARTGITQLKSILTADNLDLMAGVLSESDIKILAAIAGGGLDINGDDEAFIEELERMSLSLAREGAAPTGGLSPEMKSRLEALRKKQGG